jgi:hypothetical protein
VSAVVLSNRDGDFTDEFVRQARHDRPPPPETHLDTRRVKYTIRISAARFVPKTAADAAVLSYDGISVQSLAPTSTVTTGNASVGIADDLRARGGKIVAMRSDLKLVGGSGTGSLKLYRDTTLIGTLTAAAAGAAFLTTVSQVIGSESYRIDTALLAASGIQFPVFSYVEVDIEVDEINV